MSHGRIIKALSGFYYVSTDSGVKQCRARGKFRKDGMSPLVGDWVEVHDLDDGTGMVWEIKERKNAFVRPAVANIDHTFVSDRLRGQGVAGMLMSLPWSRSRSAD